MKNFSKHCVSLNLVLSLSLCFILGVSSSFAQSSEGASSENKGGLKIPPPIEGVQTVSPHVAQNLEIDDLVIFTASGKQLNYQVEVAKTRKQQSIGMMYRDHVKPNTGMLFIFDKEAGRSFWMKNTWVSLDILFIRGDGVVHHIHRMAEPRSLDKIPSHGAIKAVLEIAGGMAEMNNINIGDRIVHDSFSVKNEENTL